MRLAGLSDDWPEAASRDVLRTGAAETGDRLPRVTGELLTGSMAERETAPDGAAGSDETDWLFEAAVEVAEGVEAVNMPSTPNRSALVLHPAAALHISRSAAPRAKACPFFCNTLNVMTPTHHTDDGLD